MILATAVGFALQRFAAVPDAMLFGLLIGLVAAPLVPSTTACGVPGRPGSDRAPGEP